MMNNKGELLYFSSENCAVCKSLKQKIFQEVSKTFPQISISEIKIEEKKEIANKYQVFSVPTIIVFFDNQEFLRENRYISVPIFLQKIQRIYELME